MALRLENGLYLTRLATQSANGVVYLLRKFAHRPMTAEPLLHKVALALAQHRLEAVMVGNAAAALHGAPVTTLDIDFMFRKTPANLKKLKGLARTLDASIFKPYYPVSDLYRIVNDDQGIQLDFMGRLHGVRSFEGLRSRATSVTFGEHNLSVACLADIIKSKRTTGRARDLAVLDILEKTLDEQTNQDK